MKRSILKFKWIGTALITLTVCAITYVLVGIATPAAAQTIQPQTISTQIIATAVSECNKRGWCYLESPSYLCVPCDGSCFALETTPTASLPSSTVNVELYWFKGLYAYKNGRYKTSDLSSFYKFGMQPRNTVLTSWSCFVVNTTRKTIDFKAGSEYFRIQYGLTAN